MSVLRSIEGKLESLFEGVFGRAFRTTVQPVELARKLAKEMDDHRTVSVSRVYVPNEYTIYLSPKDREQFESYEGDLLDELADYLTEHARREKYALMTPPVVKLETDDDLGLGVFGIATRMVQTARAAPAAARPVETPPIETPLIDPAPSATMIYRPEPVEERPDDEPGAPAFLSWQGQTRELDKPRTVIGRSRECDIQVSDSNVSRQHAELLHEGHRYWLVDLGSTNGIEAGGKRVQRLELEEGTRFTVGSTELTFSREPR
ncbi:MAG: FhaA domain-containing protein [Gaiellaceae bacterium]